jgi:hypothetical protein
MSIIDTKKWILATTVMTNAPVWAKGVRSGNELIKKKNISSEYFIYGRLINGNWTEHSNTSVKLDKIFIKKSYLDKIKLYTDEINNIEDEDADVKKAPEIIELNDDDKFKDDEGNVLEIETRGERKWDKIFFRVSDVSKGFEMKQLSKTLTLDHTGYKDQTDYVYFTCFLDTKLQKNKKKKYLFLTYRGMLRVLFCSNNNRVGGFIKWAVEKLFTIQMGMPEQKKKLTADILGVTAETISQVFDKDARSLPCIYFFTLGFAKDLRKSMDIDNKYKDDNVIGIYGFTKDLARRTNEHIRTYKNLEGCELKLKWYSYIDPQYMSNAESDVRSCMNALNSHLSYKNEKEIVILTKEYMKIVSDQYELASSKYMGHISELITRIKELETKIETERDRHKHELAKVIHEKEISEIKYEKELEKKDFQIALLSKDIEILNLKVSHKSSIIKHR